jgi:hypothetical protein
VVTGYISATHALSGRADVIVRGRPGPSGQFLPADFFQPFLDHPTYGVT